MLTRHACTAAELSCVIGNIFAELSPPCGDCGAERVTITGTTVTGNAATLTITEAGFDFGDGGRVEPGVGAGHGVAVGEGATTVCK